MTSTPLVNIQDIDAIAPVEGIDAIAPEVSAMTDSDPMGADTITFSAISPDDPGMGADTVTFSATTTSWGEGDGLNGDILRPENTNQLIDILDKVTFDATIYSNDHLRHSNLQASVNAFDKNGNHLFDDSVDYYASNNSSAVSIGGGYNSDQIDFGDDTTDVYYDGGLSNEYQTRDLLRNIGNSNIIENDNSISLFIRPESIRNVGIISTSDSSSTNYNPESKDFNTLSTSAPIAIEINNAISTELRASIAASQINLDNSSFNGISTDLGNYNNVTIKLSDYQDDSGNIDFTALNSDQRFTFQLNNDAAEKITEIDNVWAGAQFRSEGSDGNNWLYLNATDHDSNHAPGHYGYSIPTDYVENVGTDSFAGTVIELGFNEYNLSLPSYDPQNAQTEVTYFLDYVNAGFETLAGHSHLHLASGDDQISNGIQSITLDLTDWTYYDNGNNTNYGNYTPEDITINATSKANTFDLSTFNSQEDLLDIYSTALENVSFDAQYNLIDKSNNDWGLDVGDFYINTYTDNDGDNYENIYGYLHQTEISDYGQLETDLHRLSFHGNFNGEHGYIEIRKDPSESLSISGHGWGEQYNSHGGTGTPLPSNMQLNWEQFANLSITNLEYGIYDPYADFEIDTYLSDGHDDATLELSYNLYQYPDYLVDEAANGIDSLKQLAVLGDSVVESSRFVLDINAESLVEDWNIESTDITIQFDPTLFNAIQASDIKIGGALPLANAVDVSESGIIRIAAASLSDLGEGSGIYDMEALASISLDFNESEIQNLEKNLDGSLKISPLTFDISVNEQETIFSTEYDDGSGQLNREIVSMNDLGGSATVRGQEVTLYQAQINLEQQGDGLVLGTDRVIGSDASYTNLVRKGDTLTTDATWLNVGNIEANNLTYSEIWNQNAVLKAGSFSQSNLASGKFVDGVFEEAGRESTTFTADIEITGEAGSVVDMSDGIVQIHAKGTNEVFDNQGQGSSNLITFKGDLNYDGRVSMKDLAYLNAGAARQQLVDSIDENGNSVQVASEASYARDVDADFSGKIDMFDLSVLDADWGQTLHTGDEQFQGAADVSWDELDHQGDDASWDNDSFKDQNATEAETDYVGSLEAPGTSGVYGSDGNHDQGSLEGEVFQDPLVG